jgi:hypothetical protein
MIPPGVQDTNPGRPKLIVAKEAKVTPSTSFSGAIASNAALVDVVAHRMLEQDPVHGRVAGQRPERADEFLGGRRGGQRHVPGVDPGLATTVPLHPDLGDGGGVLAHQHGRQTGRRTGAFGETGGLPRGLLDEGAGERGAVHEPGLRHDPLLG